MDPQTLAILVLVGYALVGGALCFFGSRWSKIIVAVYGFAMGFLLAYSLLPVFTSMGDMPVLFVSLGAGVVVALLFVLFFYAGIFFVGFGAGVALCLLVIAVLNRLASLSLNPMDWYIYVPVLIVGCIFGSLTLNNRRIFLSVFTAYIGASALALVVDQLFHLKEGVSMPALTFSEPSTLVGGMSTVYLIALAALFVAGLVVQLTVTSKGKRNSAD